MQSDVFPIEKAALAWNDETIQWVGMESDLPDEFSNENTINAENGIVIPGFVDCHTHLAFGGWRSDEFNKRLRGKTYLEIAKEGGGILSTVDATRKTDEDELFARALVLLKKMNRIGITAVECKSGYGLTVQDELKLLRVYRRLADVSDSTIKSTFLGAHAYPPEYRTNHKRYMDLLIHEMIPQVNDENLAEFCDVFVETSAFTVNEARDILIAGKKAGLRPKLHADQLTSCGGAELAAETGAISADHLEKISHNGIKRLAEAGVIAVSLPIASLYTQQPYLNCRPLIEAGVPVAVATDFNPGSAPSFDLQLAMLLSCNHGRLTPDECLKAVTIHAAKAIAAENILGSLEPGKRADFLILDVPDFSFWIYHYKGNGIRDIILNGKPLQD